MSCYVLSTPDGHLYACSERCAVDVFGVVAQSRTGMVAMHWSRADRDVFCASCGVALGERRASAMVLHEAMTHKARAFYRQIHERWWDDVAAR